MFNYGHFAAQGRRVLADSRELVPTNTKNAYKNIQIEFKDIVAKCQYLQHRNCLKH